MYSFFKDKLLPRMGLGLAILAISLLLGASSALAATYTVGDYTDSPDDGECVSDTTLRDAFGCAALNAGPDTIDFSGSGTITFTANGPNVTDTGGLIIDGGGDVIFDGDGETYNGIDLAGDGITIKSLTFDNFTEADIYVTGSNITVGGSNVADRNYILGDGTGGNGILFDNGGGSDNTIQNNYIGIESDGTTQALNQSGIYLQGDNSNITIEDNVIVSDNYCSIVITGVGGSLTGDIEIVGNKIGTNAAGTADKNNGSGICDSPAVGGGAETISASLTIGGDTVSDSTARNIISGNGSGIVLKSDYTGGVLVQGNYIGTNAAGTGAVANGQGIELQNSTCSGGSGCLIGGDTTGKRNVISGNSSNGIYFYGDSSGWTVQNNYIGMDNTGATALLNTEDGINIAGSANSLTIGETGATVSTYNVIAGNGGDGIEFSSLADVTQSVVNGNYIGLNAAGDAADSNGGHNININGGSPNVQIGNSSATSPTNVVAGTGASNSALYIDSTSNPSTINVYSTIFGLVADQSGEADPDGGTAGPLVYMNNIGGAASVAIGSTRTAGFNVIAGGDDDGIQMLSSGSGGLTVTGNFIGISSDEGTVVGNAGDGIDVRTTAYIGSANTAEGNVIGGHSKQIEITDASSSTEIIGNYIGMTTAGLAITGSENGISDGGSSTLVVGDTANGGRNYFAGSGGAISLTGVDGATLYNNYIGVTPVGGAITMGEGLVIAGNSTNIVVGGDGVSQGNVISNVSDSGIVINSNHATDSGVVVMGNTIGLNPDGDTDLGNSTHGIDIQQGINVYIGVNGAGDTHAGNVIGGNGGVGVYVSGSSGDVTTVKIEANYIGINGTGTGALANDNHGIQVDSVPTLVTIGGADGASRNIISGNGGSGIRLENADSTVITGNYIGTGAVTTTDVGNTNAGIYLLSGASSNVIGVAYGDTVDLAKSNVINFNASGVNIDGATTNNNTVRGNLIGSGGSQIERIGINNSGNNAIDSSGTSITTSTTSRVGGTTDFADGAKADIYSQEASTGSVVYEGTVSIASGAFQLDQDFTAVAGDAYFLDVTEADGDTSASTADSTVVASTAPSTPTASGQTTPVAATTAQTLTITKDAYSSLIRTDVDPDSTLVAVDTTTSYEFSTGTLSEGDNTFTFVSKDYSDATSDTLTVTIAVDTTAPSAPTVTSDTTTTSSSFTITGTKEANASVKEDGSEVVAADVSTTWSYAAPTLSLGANAFSFTQVDAMSNTSDATAYTVTYSDPAPDAPTVTSATSTTSSPFTITGTKESGASINDSGSEVVAADSATTWSYVVNLGSGSNSFSLTQTNSGNTSDATALTVTYTPATTAVSYVGGGGGSSGSSTTSSTTTSTTTGDDDDDDDDTTISTGDDDDDGDDDDTTTSTGDDDDDDDTTVSTGDDDDDDDDDTTISTGGDDDDDDDTTTSTGDDDDDDDDTTTSTGDDDDDDSESIDDAIEDAEGLYPVYEPPVDGTPVDAWPSSDVTTESVAVTPVTIETATTVDLIQNEQSDEIYENKDEDTISDDWEVYYFDSTTSVDAAADSDRDGLTNAEEFELKTDPTSGDSDQDGVPDGLEYSSGTSLTDWDTDSDGLSDALESVLGSDPLSADSDGDGYTDGEEYYSDGDATSDASTPQDADGDGAPDTWEVEYNVTTHNYGETLIVEAVDREIKLTFAMTDSDGDGLSDAEELKYGTDPLDDDTDGDGETDGSEVHEYKTNPRADTSTDLFYVTRLSNLNETEINTFADPKPLLRGVSEPSKEVTIYMIPQEWIEVKKARFAFARMLMASLFGSDSDVITYETMTDEGGKFLARPDAADGDYLVFARSEEGAESVLYKMTVDTRTGVDWVNPEQLDTKLIDVENLRMINIDNNRPYLYGTAKEGYEVVTSWASELHTSSLIMDSDEGEFITLAPAELEDGDHDLYVYAVDPLQNLYSSVIEIDFNVLTGRLYESAQEDSATRMSLFLYGFGGVFVVIVFWLIARARKERYD